MSDFLFQDTFDRFAKPAKPRLKDLAARLDLAERRLGDFAGELSESRTIDRELLSILRSLEARISAVEAGRSRLES